MGETDPRVRAVLALPVGDPRRVVAGRAVMATLAAAVVFVAFAFTAKEVRPIYAHAPWQNDPYDAATSFAIFLVPLGIALVLVRALLSRRDAPLPAARFVGALRASVIVLATVAVTLVGDWISVGVGAESDLGRDDGPARRVAPGHDCGGFMGRQAAMARCGGR